MGFFQRIADERYEKATERHLEQLKAKYVSDLTPESKSRFGHLEMLRRAIRNQSDSGEGWYRDVVRKLDYLIEKFLMFGARQAQFAAYLDSLRIEAGVMPPSTAKSPGTPAARLIADEQGMKAVLEAIKQSYANDIQKLVDSSAAETNPHNQALLQKRSEVLERRAQYVGQLGDILINVNQQLCLMEDTFGLINDEIRARSPEQVLAEIDDLVNQTDRLTDTLLMVAPFDTGEAVKA